MSLLYPKSFNSYVMFDKQKVIDEIKERLPNPWVWYTLGDIMDEVDNPNFDLIIMRNKEVNEINVISRHHTRVEIPHQSIVSVVIGIHVVDTFSMFNKLDTYSEFVTASLEVKSASILLETINNIDNNIGGIKNVS